MYIAFDMIFCLMRLSEHIRIPRTLLMLLQSKFAISPNNIVSICHLHDLFGIYKLILRFDWIGIRRTTNDIYDYVLLIMILRFDYNYDIML